MAQKVTVKRSAANDCLTAEVLNATKSGAVQIRCVVPLAPIRRRMGAGNESRVEMMAGQVARQLIDNASEAETSATTNGRVARILKLLEGGAFEQFGGLEGYAEHIAECRKRTAHELLKRGVPRDEVIARLRAVMAQDEAVFEEVSERTDGMGFRLLRKLRNKIRRRKSKPRQAAQPAEETQPEPEPEPKGQKEDANQPEDGAETSPTEDDEKPSQRFADDGRNRPS